jgi:hypothetical protein
MIAKLRFMSFVVIAIAVVFWDWGRIIQNRVLSQPNYATAQYPIPIEMKGEIHYGTQDQERWNRLTEYGFLGCWLIVFGLFVVGVQLEKRKPSQRSNPD